MDSNLTTLERDYYEARNRISEDEAKAKQHQRSIHELQSAINGIKDQKAEYKFRIQSAYEKPSWNLWQSLMNLLQVKKTKAWI